MDDVKAAYASTKYAAQRADTELITQQFILNRQADRTRPDLWCPIAQPRSLSEALAEQLQQQRNMRITDNIQLSATSQAERAAHEAGAQAKSSTNSVAKLNRMKHLTAETLMFNANLLRGRES